MFKRNHQPEVVTVQTRAKEAIKEEKGIGTILGTIAVVLMVVAAGIMLTNWYKGSQQNMQSNVDSQQSSLFSSASNLAG